MENTLNARKAPEILGVTVKTLQRWEREGKLIPVGRTESKSSALYRGSTACPYGAATGHGCELMVLNQERLSPEQEMVQDLMTIVHGFSSRLYGLPNYRRKLHEALEQDHAAGASHQA
jgi:predicted site-specific integrase-resolvase